MELNPSMHRCAIPLFGLLALFAGCDSTEPRPEPAVEFIEESFASAGGRPDSVSITGGTGEILLAGLLTIPNPCFRLSGRAVRRADTATVTQAFRRLPTGCNEVVSRLTYRARVAPLAPGAYTVLVRIDVYEPVSPREVARARIVVR